VLVKVAEVVRGPSSSPVPGLIGRDLPAPAITGVSLDGVPFDLTSLRGRPVVVNFWGPSCVPCREEFPLFRAELASHATDGLAIVGVLMDDPAAPARDFVADYGATWPTVDDPDRVIRNAYRVAARPQSFFIDRDGILRAIQVGVLDEALFASHYALIAGAATGTP
jgi:cytochrome c biogenesis protein CcmG/thiol:disulfide interchange protein DsbE